MALEPCPDIWKAGMVKGGVVTDGCVNECMCVCYVCVCMYMSAGESRCE